MTGLAPVYRFERLAAEHAAGVSACARRIYGEVYPRPEIYAPDAVAAHNASGEWVSLVALRVVGGRDEVVGHMALEPSRFGRVAEMGMGMVLPEDRRHHVLERLRDAVVAEAARLGLAGQYVELETSNVAAQALANRSPAQPSGVTLGLWPGFGDSAGRRLSFIRYHRYLERPRATRIHAPPAHREILERIYAQFEIVVASDGSPVPDDRAELVLERHPRWGSAVATATGIAPSTFDDLTGAVRDFRLDPRLEALFLELPLASARAPALCAHAEQLGFVFAGVCPQGARHGDALRLQQLKHPIALPPLSHPVAQAIYDHIAIALERGPRR